MSKVPKDFPVKPLVTQKQKASAKDLCTCGTCGRSWDDAVVTGMTPAPSGRCPFEYYHQKAPARKVTKQAGPVVRIQGFDESGKVVWDATGSRIKEYRAAPDMLAALKEIEAQLANHPEANKGNSKAHYCLCQARNAIARAVDRKPQALSARM